MVIFDKLIIFTLLLHFQMKKSWFKKNYQWLIAAVLIPVIAIIISLLSPDSSTIEQNITTDEISGGVIGNNNTVHFSNQPFSAEHIKLIEKRRDYINQNIHKWYKYEDGKRYLMDFNRLVDNLIDAAKNGESILFQEILREIHFLSAILERNNEINRIIETDPSIQFLHVNNRSFFIDAEKDGQILGKMMNVLTRGVGHKWYVPDSRDNLHLDSIYKVSNEINFNTYKYDKLYKFPSKD